MDNIINGTKELLDKQYINGKSFCSGKPFSTYQKVYFSTNENIKEYIEKSNLNNKHNALSVMASGDHSFNLIEKDILNIDTFDTNALTEFYVLGIKQSMIIKYSYKEYLIILNKLLDINTSLEELTSIMHDLLPYMDIKYRNFWKYILDYNYTIQKKNNTNINLFNLLFINLVTTDKLIERNNYLTNEETYNKLKNNLNKSNISFKNVNAIDLPRVFNNGYDIMLLSNIFEYLDLKNINQYIDKLLSLMNDNGKIFLMYIFDYATKNYTRKKIFYNSNITLDDFNNYELLKVKTCTKNNIQDGVLVLNKRL